MNARELKYQIDRAILKAFADFAIHLEDLAQVAESQADNIESLGRSGSIAYVRATTLREVAIAAKRMVSPP